MSSLWQDLRFALRQLRRSPAFTATAVLTLALGIGAATAIFTLVDTILLRPLHFPHPEQILALDTLAQPPGQTPSQNASQNAPATIPSDTSYPNFFDWRSRARSFSSIASWQGQSFTLTSPAGPARRIDGLAVSADFFRVLAIEPALGRNFLRADEQPGTRSVIVSHALWQSTLSSDPSAIGRTIHLSDESWTIVGVLPASFEFPYAPDAQVIIPPSLAMEGKNASGTQRGWNQLSVLARLAPGVTLAQASAEMQLIQHTLVTQYPEDNARETAVSLKPQLEDLTGDIQRPLHLLFAAVIFLLLIACANVAGLLLTRSAARRAELALRSAIGASRPQLIRLLLIESLTLSTLGGILGLALAALALRLAPTIIPNDLPRLTDISLNPAVFLFALAASTLTGLIFGVLPAWRSSRLDPALALRDTTRTASSRSQHHLHAALIIAETALSLLLLIGAGLLLRSFNRLLTTDPGFNTRNLLTFRIGMPPRRFQHESLLALTQTFQARFAAVPGVTQSTYGFPMPLAGSNMTLTFAVDSQPTPPAERPSARASVVSANFFSALQLPLLQGRLFSPAEDRPNSPPVIIINQALAAKYFPGQSPLGKRITSDLSSTDKTESREIVGIVANVTRKDLADPPTPEYYIPYAQVPIGPPIFALRVTGDPAAYSNLIRTLVAQQDPTLPVYAVRTNLRTRSTAQQRFQATLVSAFAALALLLAATGLYGVLSYMVAQRHAELGLRLALGAQRANILTLILRRGLTLSVIGLVLGLAASFALTRSLASILFRTPALDPLTFALCTVILFAVSALACLLPSWRAAHLNPIDTIRQQ